MIFSKSFRYRFGDIDDAGIAYYPSFFHYFHCCFEDWWSDALATPYHKVLHEEKFGLPAVHVEGDFFNPVTYGDEPTIHLGILALGQSSVKFAFWMSGAEGQIFCRAKVVTVAVDMDSMKKQPIPAKWRKVFQDYVIEESQVPNDGK